MTKNFVKVMVAGFGIGCILTKIYDWGRADGVDEMAGEAMAFVKEVEEIVKKAEKTE